MSVNTCKHCGATITWRLTRRGKWQPCDLDGSPHFPTCRRRVAEGRARVRAWYAQLQEGDGATVPGDTIRG
jgi:hypothetical protein